MINGRTYYDILDLPKYGINDEGERITYSSIERAYNRLRYGIGNGEYRANTWEMPQINEAFRILANPETRNEYDIRVRNISNYEKEDIIVEEPVQEVPEAPVQDEPEAPVQDEPEAPVQDEPEAPVQDEPEAPAQDEPEAPVQDEPEAPVQDEPEAPVQDEPEAPVQDEPEAPVQDEPEAPAQDEPEEKEEKTEEEKALEEPLKTADFKKILTNTLIIGGSLVLAGPVGAVVAFAILKKKGKLKLEKSPKSGIIKSIKTEETKYIEEYCKKLETSIDNLLNQPHMNYELEIARLKYKNQIDLLEKRIEFKKNEKEKLGIKARNLLELKALEFRLEASIRALELRKKIAEKNFESVSLYEPSNKKSKLSTINEDLSKLQKEYETKKDGIKAIRIRKLNGKKVRMIEKMALKKNGIARKQLLFSFFGKKNEIENHMPAAPEITQEEQQKTK